jgi:hypothetical protein
VAYEGIQNLTLGDVRYALDLGYVIKLIGAARIIDGAVSVRVFPALVPKEHPLASINGANNAVFLQGTEIGEIMVMGPGAGGRQTATAVVSDIVSITNTTDVGFLESCSCYRELGFYPADQWSRPLHRDDRGVRIGCLGAYRSPCSESTGVYRQRDPEGAGLRRRVLITHPTKKGISLRPSWQEARSCRRDEPTTDGKQGPSSPRRWRGCLSHRPIRVEAINVVAELSRWENLPARAYRSYVRPALGLAAVPNLLDRTLVEINDLQPDMVVVTGDLTANGFRQEFREAREYLDRLACPDVLVVPGNHDSRNVGYAHFERLFATRDA